MSIVHRLMCIIKIQGFHDVQHLPYLFGLNSSLKGTSCRSRILQNWYSPCWEMQNESKLQKGKRRRSWRGGQGSEIMVRDLCGRQFTFYLKANWCSAMSPPGAEPLSPSSTTENNALAGPFNNTRNQQLTGQETRRLGLRKEPPGASPPTSAAGLTLTRSCLWALSIIMFDDEMQTPSMITGIINAEYKGLRHHLPQ